MELREFLNYFNFDYYFFNDEGEKEIKLIDLAGCNLGGIEKDSFPLSEDGMMAIIERLEIYEEDYIFDFLKCNVAKKGILPSDNWQTLFAQADECGYITKESKLHKILLCICGEEKLSF